MTAIEEDEEIVIRHFLDSVSVSLCLEEKGIRVDGLSLCDVGSGAGFPGVPLKIYYKDSINLTLIESVAKKCAFLEYIKVKLGLSYRVICKDAGRDINKTNMPVKINIRLSIFLIPSSFTFIYSRKAHFFATDSIRVRFILSL